MKKDQLFNKKIPDDLFNKLIRIFGINNVEDYYFFTKNNLIQLDSVTKLINIRDELIKYYLPCKARTYLNGINIKNCITILRQVLKTRGYTLKSKEKYNNGSKCIVYTIIKLETEPDVNPFNGFAINHTKTTIVFD